jgi:hypothetical protein
MGIAALNPSYRLKKQTEETRYTIYPASPVPRNPQPSRVSFFQTISAIPL